MVTKYGRRKITKRNLEANYQVEEKSGTTQKENEKRNRIQHNPRQKKMTQLRLTVDTLLLQGNSVFAEVAVKASNLIAHVARNYPSLQLFILQCPY
jgi:hypothetical protein